MVSPPTFPQPNHQRGGLTLRIGDLVRRKSAWQSLRLVAARSRAMFQAQDHGPADSSVQPRRPAVPPGRQP
jgi:hypothetical protein